MRTLTGVLLPLGEGARKVGKGHSKSATLSWWERHFTRIKHEEVARHFFADRWYGRQRHAAGANVIGRLKGNREGSNRGGCAGSNGRGNQPGNGRRAPGHI